VAGTIFYFTCVVVVYQNQSLQMRQRVSSLAAEIPPFLVFFSARKSGSSASTAHIAVYGFGHKKCAKKKLCPREDSRPEEGR
jgi:hypothetical protein